MRSTDIVNFSNNVSSILEHTIKYDEPLNVDTGRGRVVILSDRDYREMKETLYLLSVPGMRGKLLKAKAEPLAECIPEEEVEW